MNILPKKSWHVRNKDNIERVRKDEEQAANEEKDRLRRVAIAECEARTEHLRAKARLHKHDDDEEGYEEPTSTSLQPTSSTNKHINFFEDLEQGKKTGGKNVEHEEEKKQEKEAAEKAIGLLTYLGQGSVELQATKPWYFTAPIRTNPGTSSSSTKDTMTKLIKEEEREVKRKRSLDPMDTMKKYVSLSEKVHAAKEEKSGKVNKDAKRPKTGSSSLAVGIHGPSTPKTVEQMRAERLKREQEERERERNVLARLRGETKVSEPVDDDRQRRFNSQFNPDFVRRPKPPPSNAAARHYDRGHY